MTGTLGPTMTPRSVPTITRVLSLAAALVVVAAACSSSHPKAAGPTTSTLPPGEVTTTTTPDAQTVVIAATGGNIDAYLSITPYTRQRVVAAGTGPDGTVPHGQVCFVPDGSRRFVIAETRTPPGGAATAGWGLYQLTGDEIGNFRVRRTAGWDSPGAPSADAPSTYGCTFLPDGRLLTTDVGNQRTGAPTGRLVEWFAPFDGPTVTSCVIAGDLGTPLGLATDADGAIYLAAARAPSAGVWQYKGSFPKDATACASTIPPTSTLLVPGGTNGLSAPTAVAIAPSNKAMAVTSAPDGLIVAFDLDGTNPLVVQTKSSTGAASPFGIVVAPDGSIIYTDIGLAADPKGVLTPGDKAGALLVIDTSSGSAAPPAVMDRGLDAPDGLGLYVPGGGGGAASKV